MNSNIFFNITHGFQARMLLRSSISECLLKADSKLVVCSPNADEKYFLEEFRHPRISLVKVREQFSGLERRLADFRQYLLMNPSLGSTLNLKRESFRRSKPKLYYTARGLNMFLGRLACLRKCYMAAESILFNGREFDELLLKYDISLVVTGTPGFNLSDVHVLRSAKRLGIPTATAILSWDNLSSKGYMNGVPDHLLVWSDLMASEAVKYHDYPRGRIKIVGAPQFDHYAGLRDAFDRSGWRERNSIPEGAALLMYGTINPAIVPHEFRIVREIVEQVEGGGFSRAVCLWIRLHPQLVQGPYRRNIDDYLSLRSKNVRVEVPPVQDSALNWDLPKDDSLHLSHLLAASDAVITPCSTLSIDAACVDTPIVNIFHDTTGYDAGGMTCKRFKFYTHYAKILETGGITIIEDPMEFVPSVERYLMDPSLHSYGRKAILQQQLNGLDGCAGERTARALLEISRFSHKKNR